MPIAEDPEPRPDEGREAGDKDPFADLVLDEEFVKGASVKEQSGRTRMLSARWKHTPPVDPGGRRSVNDGPTPPKRRFGRKPKLQALDPWGNPKPRRRGVEWRTPLFIVLTVVVLLAALNVDGLRNWLHGESSDASNASAPVPTVAPETAPPTTAPPVTDPNQPTVAHPWAGSPAEGWPNGAEAFVLPEAKAVGVFSAEEVAEQLQLVKAYLTAANLDPKVIAGARPDAALALLDGQDRASAVAALEHSKQEANATDWFARFDPREARMIGEVVKVQGRLTYESDGAGGVLIHTDFSYVYPVEPGPDAEKLAKDRPTAPGAPPQPLPQSGTAHPVGLVVRASESAGSDWTARTIVRRVDDYRFFDPAQFEVEPKKVAVVKARSKKGNTACYVYDGFLHPQFRQFARPRPEQTGPTSDPYDRSKDLPEGTGGCGTVSRS